MIDAALSLLQRELEDYLSIKDGSATVTVDNIGLLETTNGDSLSNNISITLVNIEEESTLKNQPTVKKFPPANAIYENAPTYLNLYLLFTANYWGSNYILALKRISYVIQFIQSRNSFSYSSSVVSTVTDDTDLLDLRFTLEIYTLTFEQLNHLWGALGGRQVPFVMYKLRLIALTERRIVREAPLIQEVDTDLSPIAG
jgi:hypothetical protein